MCLAFSLLHHREKARHQIKRWEALIVKTVIAWLGVFLQAIAVFISLIAGAIVLIIASWLGILTIVERMQSDG